MTFEEFLGELHALVGRTIAVGVHAGPPPEQTQLAGFAGRLLGADELPQFFESHGVDPTGIPDVIAFGVEGGTPDRGPSRFYIEADDFRGAGWRDKGPFGRELVIELATGTLTILIEDDEQDDR